MQQLPDNAVLLLIDVQKGFDLPVWGERNNPEAEKIIGKLLSAWRKSGGPIVHVRHLSTEPNSPLRPGQSGCDFKDEAAPLPGETVIEKCVNSCFIGTNLETHLRTNGFNTLVIAGLTTDHCVSTTTRMAGNLGFKTYLIADATATFDRTTYDGKKLPADLVHSYALASLHGEFATVLESAELMADQKVAATL